ncbi:MAG TPA: thioredoxin family protein [Puia sp.]|nr:thioredoxin family protein [Puia sp.]
MFGSKSKKIMLAAGAAGVLLAGLISAYAQCKPMDQSAEAIIFSGGSWNEITAQAKKSGKYIFVDAYTTWCGPCRQLKDITFKDKKAAAFYNGNFINYSVDMEKGEGVLLADRWDITAYPSLLFFTPDGKMVMRQVGYVDGKHLIEFGEQALTRK